MQKTVIDPKVVEKTPIPELMELLASNEKGLSGSEVKGRLEQYGYNELAQKDVHPLLKLLGYFWGPIPWMIEVAAILSLVVRHWPDFIIIVVLLVFNAVVGFWPVTRWKHSKSNWPSKPGHSVMGSGRRWMPKKSCPGMSSACASET